LASRVGFSNRVTAFATPPFGPPVTNCLQLGHDHEEIEDAVHTIWQLADGYAIPGDACNTFLITFRKIKAFEEDL
jgi:iron-sulfur cluster repair protein YtfE (RIC family)